MFRNPREITWQYIFRIQSNIQTSTGHIVGTECNVSFGFPSYSRRKYFLSYCLVLFSLTVIAGSHVCCPRRTSPGGDSEAQRLEIYQAPPDRRPAPEIMESLPDPQAVLDDINKGYQRLDRYCTSFQFSSRLRSVGTKYF